MVLHPLRVDFDAMVASRCRAILTGSFPIVIFGRVMAASALPR